METSLKSWGTPEKNQKVTRKIKQLWVVSVLCIIKMQTSHFTLSVGIECFKKGGKASTNREGRDWSDVSTGKGKPKPARDHQKARRDSPVKPSEGAWCR